MNITENWNQIRQHVNKSFSSSLHVSIASVDEDGNPTVTPIGSLFLNKDQTGFYFEKFPKKLPLHANTNKNICVLAVNSNKWLWIKALFKERFDAYPALKLYGQLGERRQATETEMNRLKRRMKFTSSLKGHKYLWNDMETVRELTFTRVEKINIGHMTADL